MTESDHDALNLPDPVDLYEEALTEEPRRVPPSYGDVIVLLKDKRGFTFREIADWLKQRGVDYSHNVVYRHYKKRKRAEEVESELNTSVDLLED